MQQLRATFVAPGSQFPPSGSRGAAWPATGFADLDSAEYGAYLFQPFGDPNAYYCDPRRDLLFEDNG